MLNSPMSVVIPLRKAAPFIGEARALKCRRDGRRQRRWHRNARSESGRLCPRRRS